MLPNHIYSIYHIKNVFLYLSACILTILSKNIFSSNLPNALFLLWFSQLPQPSVISASLELLWLLRSTLLFCLLPPQQLNSFPSLFSSFNHREFLALNPKQIMFSYISLSLWALIPWQQDVLHHLFMAKAAQPLRPSSSVCVPSFHKYLMSFLGDSSPKLLAWVELWIRDDIHHNVTPLV